ncbi:hypothetical protein Bca52824_068422 [Brassica carinata]|uniref:F-box domain-containing protein n=1 Tax=Brassica carinata TaxID=52824 RepID=A0A8X7Q1S5_BRACI|nr:hypothetical protein Bca52824_068422 [Brassica carinata]
MMFYPVSANAVSPPPKCNKPTDSSLPLPDDISVICFAYVPRCDYPSLSQVSKTFNHLVASSELNRVRSLHQSTENVLYLALRSRHDQYPVWYTLNQKPYKEESNSLNHKLVPYPSFPSVPCWGSHVIVIGQEMYVLGGCVEGELTTNAFAIDCLCNKKLHEVTLNSFVMNEKIYMMDCKRSYVYDPKKNKWERENSLNSEWQVGSCVIDNMLYTFGIENGVRVYNPKARTWRSLKGVDEDLPDMRGIEGGSRMANHGGKLVILFKRNESGETKIWCTEIALERRGQGELWGKVLWSNIVATFKNSPTIVQCLDVII